MFIKLIEIYYESNVNKFSLREIVINKRSIMQMREADYFQNKDKPFMPEGLSTAQKYVWLQLTDGDTKIIVGDLDHVYKLLETDSALNYRQTLKG